MFLARSTGSPLRVFGLLGLGPLVLGSLLTLWLVWERLFLSRPLAGRPLLLLGLLLITAGLQALAIGFLGELMVYLHYRDRHPDRVRALDDRGVTPSRDGAARAHDRAHAVLLRSRLPRAHPGRDARVDARGGGGDDLHVLPGR